MSINEKSIIPQIMLQIKVKANVDENIVFKSSNFFMAILGKEKPRKTIGRRIVKEKIPSI
jgi:hypothetical protein